MTPRWLLAPLALCLLAPAAHATEPADQVLIAECGYDAAPWAEATVGDVSVGARYEYRGLAYGYAVVYDPADPANPVSASLRCEIRVNGVPVTTTQGHGTTTVVAAGPVTFTAVPTDALELCAVVAFDAGGSYEVCATETLSQIPPQEITDLLHVVLDVVLEPVGALLCALTGDDVVLDSPVPFSVAAGSRNGDLFSAGDGDLRYDCP